MRNVYVPLRKLWHPLKRLMPPRQLWRMNNLHPLNPMKVRQLGLKGWVRGSRLSSQKGQQKLFRLQHMKSQLWVKRVP